MRQLLPEQAAAAYEITKHVSVTAGPGSGKTTVLVERYLHILRRHKLSIDQIVAITFTNRAANEMRERLRAELNLILETAEGDERKHWLSYKRTLDGAVITTIHGFCARLLREFPVEAHVDPQFLLLDEHRASMLLETVVEDVLSEFISGEHPEVSRLVLGIGRSRLADHLAQLYRDVRGQGLSFEELARATAEGHGTEADHARALDDLDLAMAEFLAVRRTTPAQQKNREIVSSEWPAFRSFLATIPEHETLADYCRTIESFHAHRPQARPPVAEQVKLLDEFVWKPNLGGRVPQICLDLFAGRYALEMVSMLGRIHERLNEEKARIAALDFDDLEVRTLSLLETPEVRARASERYRFYLVDEFQDTNGLQRRLLELLALSNQRSSANLFIVGDRKQSVYGFRGADVDVFREMTETLVKAGGQEIPLPANFRSQPELIRFFNHLFSRLFRIPEDIPAAQTDKLAELGYVEHEESVAKREQRDDGPLVELLIATKASDDDDAKVDQELRALDAAQLATRIKSLIQSDSSLKYSDIALLFRAMTQVYFYESAFRRAGIPYQTILGRGFYEREEITDLIQLLRFLDNKTDELALAAVLRSPICGISDDALFALRCAPKLGHIESSTSSGTRPLYTSLLQHKEIAFIKEQEHELLDRAALLISRLISRRHHYPIEGLLRFAVDESEYMTIVSATFDGGQRLAHVQRLFGLAGKFDLSGNHLIRDFVRYVEEFEEIGSRESEGQIDQSANAIRLMTLHQAKGLEFPVVIIPDLQRQTRVSSDVQFLLDRHQGVSLKVPDGRSNKVAASTFSTLEKRQALREQFENMRLLYVGATRAQDRLIFSGAAEDLAAIKGKGDWLKWIWQTLGLQEVEESGIVNLSDDVQLLFSHNLTEPTTRSETDEQEPPLELGDSNDSIIETFPLLNQVDAERELGANRFNVTQLINYQRCPRQYYFDRILKLPSAEELAVWNNADAPEPPANLTATLKGAVIHRFCERFDPGQSVEECLRQSFADVVRLRQAELADRLVEIDIEAAIKDLLPLANNYLSSDVFKRIEEVRRIADTSKVRPTGEPGLWSELSFRLRRPLGLLSGTIDKLLINRSNDGVVTVEIIDFKTNRIAIRSTTSAPTLLKAPVLTNGKQPAKAISTSGQFAFDFEAAVKQETVETDSTIDHATRVAAQDYQLQMQAYALAVRELLPTLKSARIIVSLHFLEPNLEFHLSQELLSSATCEQAIDQAMLQLVSSSEPVQYPVKPANHCRMCNFLRICTAGREHVR